MFESKAEQVRATNAIVARYGKTVNLETDMISKEEFKQFAGMTSETMALFAKETGIDKDEAYQHYLKLAIPARSAMTRMIKRKGTEGFSDDIQRVVASFVMSNARMSAKNIYAAQIEKSIQGSVWLISVTGTLGEYIDQGPLGNPPTVLLVARNWKTPASTSLR